MVKKEGREEKLKKKKSCKISIVEGCFSSSSSNFGDNYIIPFAQALNAWPWLIGIISALPNLLSPLAQVHGSRLMETKSRKEIVLKFVLIQSLLWLPIALLGLLAWKGFSQHILGIFLAVFYSLLMMIVGIAGPPWFSWMGDIVPEKHRGAYFSKRNRITGAFGMMAFVISAFLLDSFKTHGLLFIGFSVLFSLAFLFRFIAYFFFKKQYEPKREISKKDYFSFLEFLRNGGNFRNFAVYNAILHISTMIAGPFFVVYMLEGLNFSYITFMAVSLSGTVFYLLLAPFAGEFSDRYGNLKLIIFANIMLLIYPLLWAIFKTPAPLILITQLVGGAATAAFAIGTTNFIYGTVTPAKRGLCVAYMNILGGIGIFTGALIGGFLLGFLKTFSIRPFVYLFLISFVLRTVVGAFILPNIKEIKIFKKVPPVPELLMILGNRPLKLFGLPFIWTRNISLSMLKKTEREGGLSK